MSLNWWEAPVGTSGYTFAMGMEDIAKKSHPWLRIKAAETPGYVYNIKAHDANPALWSTTIIGTSPILIYLASKVMSPFDEKILGYKYLTSRVAQALFLVSMNPDITTGEDLIGKKIALGYKTQIGWGVVPSMLIVDGLEIGDKCEIVYVGTTPALHALLDGTADACVTGMYMNPASGEFGKASGLIEMEASGRTLYPISWGEEAVANCRAKGEPILSYIVPAGTVKDQTEDMVGGGIIYLPIARDVFPEDLAYEFTKVWLEHGEKLAEYHALGKLVSAQSSAFGMTKKNLHPGSLRAFEEAGITIPEK